jgi:hypothetical protein
MRRRSARPVAAAFAAAAIAVAAGGCGAGYPDLFVLTRSGSIPGAQLTLLVNDGGTVRCDGAKAVRLPDPQLLAARDIATRLADAADRGLVLPAAPGSVLRFRLRSQNGTVTFSDTDAGRRPELAAAVAFARTVARDVCGLAR